MDLLQDDIWIKPSSVFGEWSNDGRDFVFRREKLPLVNYDKTLVMVSFIPHSSFGRSLRDDSRLLAYFSSASSGVGRALLALRSPAERDALARASHEDTHVCGGLEVLADGTLPKNLSTTLGDAASPVIATSVALPSIAALLEQVSTTQLQDSVATLEAMGSRYHGGSQPNQVTDAVYSRWQALAPSGASVTKVSHGATTQKSVVVTIPGSTNAADTVVLGAHLDSINNSTQTDAPGADDNASGIAALTEILRIIKTQGMSFARTLELHAYAAEEVGLLGSADLAASASSSNKNVVSMLQLDMIGYAATKGDETIHLITTDTSPVLVRHLKDLIAQYLGNTWSSAPLNAGTSDHRSWYRRGFHTAFAFEHPTQYNHALHTAQDTASKLDFTLAARFTKLALAFVAHEAGLGTAITDSQALWASQQSTANLIKLSAARAANGSYRLGAALEQQIEADTAELCQISAGIATGCKSLITETTGPLTKSGRKFFVTTTDTALSDGDLWRVNIYNGAGALTATRSFRLRQKTALNHVHPHQETAL
jgi:leucyl aminopeptidase